MPPRLLANYHRCYHRLALTVAVATLLLCLPAAAQLATFCPARSSCTRQSCSTTPIPRCYALGISSYAFICKTVRQADSSVVNRLNISYYRNTRCLGYSIWSGSYSDEACLSHTFPVTVMFNCSGNSSLAMKSLDKTPNPMSTFLLGTLGQFVRTG
eukprot:TRINITY_DN18062_c0_g1_i1.p2 TRINITY_DN18062_c0_g1~~TRINITY_DN18062_c0_g1_i1.p2  ORF type:complete len:156 (+),score=21.61 TRINITY_DN18062_c0_g1_i1:384-851(+)